MEILVNENKNISALIIVDDGAECMNKPEVIQEESSLCLAGQGWMAVARDLLYGGITVVRVRVSEADPCYKKLVSPILERRNIPINETFLITNQKSYNGTAPTEGFLGVAIVSGQEELVELLKHIRFVNLFGERTC